MCSRTLEDRWAVPAKNGEEDSTVEVWFWDEAIEMKQGPDIIYLQDARQARKVIKAIKKSSKALGWEV